MTTPDPFESPRLLIEGARLDVKNLDVGFKSFVNECKAVPIEDRDPKSGERVAKLSFPKKMPGSLRVLASNALNNLRHALDQSVNCASLELGGGTRNYFPIAENASNLDSVLRVNCKTVPTSLHAILRGFQPYPGGDDLLCMVRMANKNKHRELLELSPELSAVRFSVDGSVGGGPLAFGHFVWDSKKQELEYARMRAGAHLDLKMKGKISLRVTLRDGPVAQRQEPAAAILYALADKVERILLALESETARLRGSL